MINKTFTHSARDNVQLFVYTWFPDNNKGKAIVHIIHGMAEHAGRYEGFARELTDNNYIVYAHDQRGHGKTALNKDDLGYLGKNKSFNDLVGDIHELGRIIRHNHPGLPVFLFCHSLGTCLSLGYMKQYGNDIKGCIFSGQGYPNMFLLKYGKFIILNEIKKNGERFKSLKIHKLGFGAYNKPFKPYRTEFDWLNRDCNEVDAYIEDPLCGFICSLGFYLELSTWLKTIFKKENLTPIPQTLPLFLCSGEKDSVGNMGKDIKILHKMYIKAGIKDVTYKLYSHARHEIVNELNKKEVIKDILSWLNIHNK